MINIAYENAKTFVINPADEVLVLTRRLLSIHRPGGPDLVGGGLKLGESAVEAAIREAQEEAALTLEDITPLYTFTTSKTFFAAIRFECITHLFKGHVDDINPAISRSKEHRAEAWMPKVIIPTLKFPEKYKTAAEQL